jgi:hypothetical protein
MLKPSLPRTCLVGTRVAGAADGHERVVALRCEVVRAQVAVLYVVQRIAMRGTGGALALQLEDNHAAAGRYGTRATGSGIMFLTQHDCGQAWLKVPMITPVLVIF